MKKNIRIMILTGGILNLLLAIFHVFLCYKIYEFYNTMAIFPLLEMFSIGGMIMVFFLAYTSLNSINELGVTKSGRAIIILNILVYFTRVLGEFILFPKQSIWIIALCSFLTILYCYIFAATRSNPIETVNAQAARQE